IQELALILDVRNGVVLAFDLFGASEFGSRRSLPKGFQNDHSAGQWDAAGEGFVCPHFRASGSDGAEINKGSGAGPETRTEKRSSSVRWGVERMVREPEGKQSQGWARGACRDEIDCQGFQQGVS